MPVDTRELMAAIANISEIQQIRVCFNESVKGGVIAGMSTIAGGLILGPVGLAIGGALGGLTAAYLGQDKFRSLAQIILHDMSPEQQRQLQIHILNAVRDVDITDLAMLLPLLLQTGTVQTLVIDAVNSYAVSEMGLKLIK